MRNQEEESEERYRRFELLQTLSKRLHRFYRKEIYSGNQKDCFAKFAKASNMLLKVKKAKNANHSNSFNSHRFSSSEDSEKKPLTSSNKNAIYLSLFRSNDEENKEIAESQSDSQQDISLNIASSNLERSFDLHSNDYEAEE